MQPNTSVRQYRAKTPLSKRAIALCALLVAANLAMLWMLFDTSFVRGAGRLPIALRPHGGWVSPISVKIRI